MHDQSWGFEWGRTGDEVQFIRSTTMELIGTKNKITAITPYDKDCIEGAREFLQFSDKQGGNHIPIERYSVTHLP